MRRRSRPLEAVEVVYSARARSLGASQLEKTLRALSTRNVDTESFKCGGELPEGYWKGREVIE